MIAEHFSDNNQDLEERFIFSREKLTKILGYGSKVEGEKRLYTNDEKAEINKTIDRLYEKITSLIEPAVEGEQKVVLVVGGAGAGKTTFMRKVIEEPNNNFALIEMDEVRGELKLFQEALSEKRRHGASEIEADHYAFKKYSKAGVYVGRMLENCLFANGYNMIACIQPSSLDKHFNNFISVREQGAELKVKFFDVPFDGLKKAVETRTQETGRGLQKGEVEKQYNKLPDSILKVVDNGIDTEFYWRKTYDSDAELVAETLGDGKVWCKDNDISHVIRFMHGKYSGEEVIKRYEEACASGVPSTTPPKECFFIS